MAIFNTTRGGRDGDIGGLPPAPQPLQPASGGMFSVIGPDVVITGNIATTADLHNDGRVDGDVPCGNLVQRH